MISIEDVRKRIALRKADGTAERTPAVGMEQAKPSLVDQVACARRELKFRERTYPKQVANGMMTRDQAETELTTMGAIIRTLETCRMLEEVSEEIKAGK